MTRRTDRLGRLGRGPTDIRKKVEIQTEMKTHSRSSILATLILVAILPLPCSLYLTGCANVATNPNTVAALNSVLHGAVAYASGNDVGAAIDGIEGASYFVRALQSTSNAANPSAVAAAVTTGGASASLGKTVASAITSLVKAGVAPDDANETIAEQLDQAVLQSTEPPGVGAGVGAGGRPGKGGVSGQGARTSDAPDSVPGTNAGAALPSAPVAELLRGLRHGRITPAEFETLFRAQILLEENAALQRKLSFIRHSFAPNIDLQRFRLEPVDNWNSSLRFSIPDRIDEGPRSLRRDEDQVRIPV
jgi:hypothetical protein